MPATAREIPSDPGGLLAGEDRLRPRCPPIDRIVRMMRGGTPRLGPITTTMIPALDDAWANARGTAHGCDREIVSTSGSVMRPDRFVRGRADEDAATHVADPVRFDEVDPHRPGAATATSSAWASGRSRRRATS